MLDRIFDFLGQLVVPGGVATLIFGSFLYKKEKKDDLDVKDVSSIVADEVQKRHIDSAVGSALKSLERANEQMRAELREELVAIKKENATLSRKYERAINVISILIVYSTQLREWIAKQLAAPGPDWPDNFNPDDWRVDGNPNDE